MIQARLRHDAVVEVVKIYWRQKFHVVRGNLGGVLFRQISHTRRSEIVTLGIVGGVDR